MSLKLSGYPQTVRIGFILKQYDSDHLYFYYRERVLHPLYNRLYLPTLQGLLQGVLYEPGTGNHGGGLFHRVVLAKGDKVDVLHVEQQADVLKVDAQGIVGGYGNHQGPAVSQMCFRGHEDRGVRYSVGQFCQGVAGAGGDE